MFQYPTEKSLASISKACIARLYALNDRTLIMAITTQSIDTAKQICLYAMMKRYRLVWDFMLTVIGEKYRLQEFFFGKKDINVFFMQIQEQDDFVSSWSDSTIKKIRQEEFLEGKGLSNEVNIRIFCYDPKEEMTVRHFIEQLIVDQSLECHLIQCNLYQIFLEICDEKRRGCADAYRSRRSISVYENSFITGSITAGVFGYTSIGILSGKI